MKLSIQNQGQHKEVREVWEDVRRERKAEEMGGMRRDGGGKGKAKLKDRCRPDDIE